MTSDDASWANVQRIDPHRVGWEEHGLLTAHHAGASKKSYEHQPAHRCIFVVAINILSQLQEEVVHKLCDLWSVLGGKQFLYQVTARPMP